MRITKTLLLTLCVPLGASAAVGFRVPEDIVYTLYRNSVVAGGLSMRMHVATFDAAEGEDYNRGNCDIARELFQSQKGVAVKYWCEKGYFKK